MGAFLFCRRARNTPSWSVVVLLLIRCLPKVAEEDFTAFRKLVDRNLCQPSANSVVAFSRSRFSISGGHPQPRSGSVLDSDMLPASQRVRRSVNPFFIKLIGRTLCPSVRLSKVPFWHLIVVFLFVYRKLFLSLQINSKSILYAVHLLIIYLQHICNISA